MSLEDQFEAAVKVIQGLPKDGAYQPSHALMLKFYGYYKQSTVGQCNIKQPSFWDVVGKAKFAAWNDLGNMSKEEAMGHYVAELKKIVETMSYSTDVATFTQILGPFYEYVADLSPAGAEAQANQVEDKDQDSGVEETPSKYEGRPNLKELLGQYDDDESPEDVERGQEQFDDNIKSLRDELLEAKKVVDDYRNSFHATEDHQQAITALPIQKTFHHSKILPPNETAPLQPENMDNESKGKHEVSDDDEDLFEDTKGPDFFMSLRSDHSYPSSAGALNHAIQLMNKDIEHIKARIGNLENAAFKERQNEQVTANKSGYWPGEELSKSTMIFVISWPFVAHGIMSLANSLRRTK